MEATAAKSPQNYVKQQPYLFEGDFAVLVLVHLLDHLLEAEVRLRGAEPLHHELHLEQVQVAVAAQVEPATRGEEGG